MSDTATIEKIHKLEEKRKSAAIIKHLHKADSEVLVAAIESLGHIADEDSCNYITHYLDDENKEVRLAACKAEISIGTEYMKTRVRHQLSIEKDPEVKKQIQDAFNQKAS